MTWLAVTVLSVGGVIGCSTSDDSSDASDRVDDSLSTPVPDTPAGTGTSAPPTEPDGPVRVAEGSFIDHEYATSGAARIIQNPDGSHQLEIADLETSGGPDLAIWLTDQPVIEGEDGWHVFDDGEWVDLGSLKGTSGNQVYEIPDDVDPADFTSVTVWCREYAVSFGAAALDSA